MPPSTGIDSPVRVDPHDSRVLPSKPRHHVGLYHIRIEGIQWDAWGAISRPTHRVMSTRACFSEEDANKIIHVFKKYLVEMRRGRASLVRKGEGSISVHDRPGDLHRRPTVSCGRYDRDIPGRAMGTPEEVTASVVLELDLGPPRKHAPVLALTEHARNSKCVVANTASDLFQWTSPRLFVSGGKHYKNNANPSFRRL